MSTPATVFINALRTFVLVAMLLWGVALFFSRCPPFDDKFSEIDGLLSKMDA